MISLMWNLKNKQNTKLLDTENRRWLPEVGVRGGQNGGVDQKLQTSSYKINKLWEYNEQYGDCSLIIVYCVFESC